MSQAKPQTIYLKDYTQPNFLIDTIYLDIALFEDKAKVVSKMVVRRKPDTPNVSDLILHGSHMDLISVKLNSSEPNHSVDESTLTVHDVPDTFELETQVIIKPQENTSLMGLYRSQGIFCTQCEAEGFRKITYYLDRPDVMATFTTKITADKTKYPVLLANGNLVNSGDNADGTHWVLWEDPFKKPSYLFAMVAGSLDVVEDTFTTMSGREVKLQVFSELGQSDKCYHALDALKKSMKWDEEKYGREYDLDIYMIVAVSTFNMGAMENKGLNVFNDKYILARPDTATDDDFNGVDIVVGHEYFHNWSGNRVTCRDWFQLSLKEGFTVFREQSFTEDITSIPVARIDQANLIRSAQFIEDAGPLAHPVRPESFVEINNFYTLTVYHKGSELIRMMKTILGAEDYRKGTDLYFERHDGQAVTTDDFVKAMEDASGKDLSQFKRWYSQAGTPVVDVSENFDADNHIYTITMEQHIPDTPGQSNKLPHHIPVTMGLLDNDGNEIVASVLHLKEEHQTFVFEDIKHKPVASLFRHFSAPVKVNFNYTDDELYFLMSHDSDDYNRWASSQAIALKQLLKQIKNYQQNRPMQVCDKFIAAYRDLIVNNHQDKLLLSQLLVLPSEAYIGEQLDVIDFDAVHAARQFMRQQIAQQLSSELRDVYLENQSEDYHYTQPEVAKRALKNTCLMYLALNGELDLAESQFNQSLNNNMTDTMASLTCFAMTDSDQRSLVLQKFYDKWSSEPLVMDKWFSVQAQSPLNNVLDEIKRLETSPAYDASNPNRVRSLVGAFTANKVKFHDKSGSGYNFLIDRIIDIDSKNPQLAARLIQPLSQWKHFDAARQELIKACLQRILIKEDISSDMYETVTKLMG